LADPEGSTSDMITETLFKLAEKWQDTLITDTIVSGCVVSVWVLVFFIALIRTACLWWGADRVRGDGGGCGTNFNGGLPLTITPPSYTASHYPSPVVEEDEPGLHFPGQAYNPGPETVRLGRVNSRKLTPAPVMAGGWADEKRRGSIADSNGQG